MSAEPESNDLADRLEKAEAILGALARNEADALVSNKGPLLVRPKDVIEKERQAKLLLEKLVSERTAELVQAKDAAEAANRAKTTFLANMSHELRTPMNAIMGMNSIVMRRTTDPALLDRLGKIETASQHLLHIINDILEVSRIEAAHLVLEKKLFKLSEVLENLMSIFGQRAKDKGLRILMKADSNVLQKPLIGDPVRLEQILINLAGNAVKFTDAGSITLYARVVEETPDNVLLRFEVQDTGIGISAEDQNRLFTAFEQADGSMTRKYGGTGLGLAISKRMAELMGGNAGVESTVGQGSTFWFTARLGKASAMVVSPEPTFAHDIAHDTAEKQIKVQYAGARILLVEDEPINQEVSRGLLEDVDLVVDLAEDGREAVAMARHSDYDLILMDMQMPNLNGVDATRAIRALHGYEHTPILAMTANAFDEDCQVCLETGMSDHIAKPIDPDVLFETLLKWLSRG